MRKKIYLFFLLLNFFFLFSLASIGQNCQHTVILYDAYSDGWDGNLLTINVDGIPVLENITFDNSINDGDSAIFTFPATTGSIITTTFTAVSYSYEADYTIFDNENNIIATDGDGGTSSSSGTAPVGLTEEDNIFGFCPEGDMEYLSGTTFSADTLIVNPGSLNKTIIGLEIISGVGIDNPFNLTSLNFNTNGSSDAITDITNARVYCTLSDSTFSTDSLYGNFENPNGDFTVNGEILLNYGKNYFWLTYDISQDATLNNFVDAECTSFVISGNTETPEVTAPAGNREISSDVYLVAGINELTTCDVMVYDEGGPNGDYENNFDGTITFYPNEELSYIQVEVLSLVIGNNEDYLKIYDGNSTDAPLVANLTGTLNDTTFIASNDGSMTIEFTTNIAGTFDGFVLNVSCYEPIEAPSIAVNPLPFDGIEVGVLDVSGTLMSWDNVPYSLGYYINFGTDNPPTNILNNEDLGFTNSYTPELDYLQTYYWQIIPYNNIGSTADCPVWSFSTSSDVPVANINLNFADFGTSTIYPPAVSDTIFNFTLTNLGVGELSIESFTDLEGTPFSTNLGLGADTISLASNETSEPFIFAFQPTEEGYFETEFTIVTSGGEITVTLSGEGYLLPSGMVEVGTGDLINQSLPMEPFYGYSYSQSIYLQHEIKEDGRIERIYYHYNGYQEWGPDAIKIYMGHTTLTGLDNWVSIDDLVEVHEGELSVEAVDGWVEIVLTTPFEYNNTDNLVVAFEENTTGYHSSSSEFFCTESDTTMSICYYNDNNNPDPNDPPDGNLMESRPNIRFLFAPIPTGPAISFSPMELDFNEIIAANDSITTTFTVINNGVENLDISGIDVEGPFVINFDGEITIEAGESYDFEIEFFPTSSGVFTGTVTFTTNATTGDGVITLMGTAYPSTYLGESFEEGFPPLGWTIENLSEGNDWTQYNLGALEGNYNAQLYYNGTNFSDGRLITPLLELNTVDEIDDFVSFYAKSNSTDAILKVEYSYDGVNFIEIDEIDLEPNYSQYVIDLNTITVIEDQGIFIAFHGITTTNYYTSIYMDVVLYPPTFLDPISPVASSNPIPEDETSELNILSLDLGWDEIFEATGYYVNIGTDNPPTNMIQNESVEENSFNLNDLEYSTTYYWQVVPYNTFGSAEECPIWSFTTMDPLPPGVVQVGFGEMTTQPLPMNCYYGYTYSQTIYTSEELVNDVEGTARIEKISYYYNGNSAFGPDEIQIYMGHTNLSNFENDSWVTTDNLALVYDGEISVTNEEGWIDIVLSIPFTYNGTDNLVVGFDENTDGFHGSSDDFYSSATDSIMSLNYYSDGTNPNPTDLTSIPSATTIAARPNTQFYFGALPTGPVVMFSSSDLSFSTIPAETEDSIQINIFNTGISDLVINSLDINPPFYSDYSGTLVPGSSDIANIYFQPTEAGIFTDTLWSNSNTSTIEVFAVLSGASYPSNYIGESFENEFHPEGWNIQNNGVNQWVQYSYGSYEGEKCARLSNSSLGNSISNLITPQLVITNNDFITFYAKKNSTSYGSLIITYSEDSINFINLDTINLSTSYESFTVSFENIPEGNYYIGFLGDLSTVYNYLSLDAVIYPPIYIPPYPPAASTEPVPADLTEDLSIFTVDMSWNNNFFANACKINFGTDQSTFTEDSAEDLGNLENYQKTSLEYGTIYYWQILPYNDYGTAENCPIWSFTTMADPTITSLPWFEDFEEPEGWLTQGTFNWTLYVPAGGDDNVQGIRALYPAYSGGNAEAISPPVVLDVDAELVFKWSHGYTTNNPTAQMQVSTSTNGLDWEVIWDKEGEDFDSDDGANSFAPGDYVNAVVSLANYNGQTVYVKFDAISEYGGYPVFVDSIEIKESVDMEFISTTTTQTNTSYIFPGYDNQEIIAVEITTEGNANPFEVTEFEFNTTGSTDAGNDITNAKVYYTGTDNDFEEINEFGSVNNPNGDFTITGTQNILGGTNYFWLVYGISENATLENIVDAQCNSVKIDGIIQNTEISIPDGDREIHIAPDTIIMGTTTEINTCFAYFYDNGGVNANYISASNETLVIYPDGADAKVKINFSIFNTYFSDDLVIYDGNSNSAPLIGEYSGSTIPEEIISSANDGSLTIEFSPSSNANAGWEAVVSCHYMIPDLELSVSSITFENTYENVAAPSHEIFIRNDGAANLNVASHQINGADASMFSVSATYPMEIIPGDSVAVYIGFTPTSYGDKIAGVLFTDVTGEYTDLALLYGHCIDPTLTPSFTETFNESVPAAGWQSYEGQLTENSNLTIVPVGWFSADFANDNEHENGASAKREPYFEENYWLVTPPINLGTQGFDLHFDLALTTHNENEESSIDLNGKFAVVISTDNGETWSSNNILQEWNNSDTISNVGESVSISLDDYSGTIRLAFYSELTQIASDGYDIFVDNVTVGTPCDLNIDLGDDINTNVIDLPYTVSIEDNYASYQWFNNGVAIDGETNNSYEITALGFYQLTLEVTDENGCQASDDINVEIFIGMELLNNTKISIYPNPNAGIFNLEINSDVKEFSFELTNMKGQVIYNKIVKSSNYKEIIDISHLEKGIYYIKVINANSVKTEKLIIK